MKTKHIFLTLGLLFLILSAKSQDKYEFMIIEFDLQLKKEIQITIDSKQYIEEKADFSPTEKAGNNLIPLLKKVGEYQDKGWELMNFAVVVRPNEIHFAYLRKKKQAEK